MLPKTKFKIFNITIIFVNAPTEDRDDAVKIFFYDTLDSVYQTITKRDAVIVRGHMNVKVGEDSDSLHW